MVLNYQYFCALSPSVLISQSVNSGHISSNIVGYFQEKGWAKITITMMHFLPVINAFNKTNSLHLQLLKRSTVSSYRHGSAVSVSQIPICPELSCVKAQ